MKNKIISLVLVLFIISSCSLKKDEQKLNSDISNNTWNIIENIDDNLNSIDENKWNLENTGSINEENNVEIKQEEDINEETEEDKYIKLKNLPNEDILIYDCKKFKSYEYIDKCVKHKNIVSYAEKDSKEQNTKTDKLKVLDDWKLSYCESYLKNKQDYLYFNCSLAIIIANEKVKCSNLKNIEKFKTYFWKSCDEVIVDMNDYINNEIKKIRYNQMVNWFWWQDNIMNSNEDLEKVYLDKIINQKQEKELKESIIKTN